VFAIQSGSIEFGSHTRQLACKAVGSITLLFKSVPLPDPLGLTGWSIELDILARATLRRSGNECQETCCDQCSCDHPSDKPVRRRRAGEAAQSDERFAR
jgi:hypothetical protein